MSDAIGVVINGEPKEVPAGLSVAELLAHLGMTAGRVAVERNLNIVPRTEWAATQVTADDRFEIVHLVGGG